jgi:hypothetical protein
MTPHGANFCEDRTHRWVLWRVWDEEKPYLNVIGLNPSTADEDLDDPTIRRCIGYAKAWGYGGLFMTNIFAFRATNPKVMHQADDPIGLLNQECLLSVGVQAGMRLAAWGAEGDFMLRGKAVKKLFQERGITLHCLGLTKNGHPKHPLYLRADAIPEVWA